MRQLRIEILKHGQSFYWTVIDENNIVIQESREQYSTFALAFESADDWLDSF